MKHNDQEQNNVITDGTLIVENIRDDTTPLLSPLVCHPLMRSPLSKSSLLLSCYRNGITRLFAYLPTQFPFNGTLVQLVTKGGVSA